MALLETAWSCLVPLPPLPGLGGLKWLESTHTLCSLCLLPLLVPGNLGGGPNPGVKGRLGRCCPVLCCPREGVCVAVGSLGSLWSWMGGSRCL